MQELTANTSDGAQEKHLPKVSVNDGEISVEVGDVHHPMTQEHSITWVYLLTQKGGQRKCLQVGEPPVVSFRLTDDDKPVAAYAYCNLHGLWKTEI